MIRLVKQVNIWTKHLDLLKNDRIRLLFPRIICSIMPMIELYSDEYFMKKAFEQAQIAADAGEVPVGAIMVCNKQIIAKSHNQTELLNDVTAHAEMLAVTSAANYLGTKYLQQCELFVTLEPCPMCAGALKWAQLGRLVYGAEDNKQGFMQYGKELLHPQTKMAYGLLHDDCSLIIKEFFQKKRTLSR